MAGIRRMKSWQVVVALICAIPASAQQVNWDGGQDPGGQSRFQEMFSGAGNSSSRPSRTARAAQGSAQLMIDATEIGVGKFHRYDNGVHSYPPESVWKGHITPAGGGVGSTPIVFDDDDGYVSIQFSNLDELLKTVVALAQKRSAKIGVLNIHGHGAPGAMWYPKDKAQQASDECQDWRQAAAAPDEDNYNQYYSAIPKEEVMAIRRASQGHVHFSCTTGAPEWREVAARIPNIKDYFAEDAQIHFLSCVVGMGSAGEEFTTAIAGLLTFRRRRQRPNVGGFRPR